MAGAYDHEPARAALDAAAYTAMREWAQVVLGEAQRDAPIEFGELRASGTIIEREVLAAEGAPAGVLNVGAALPDNGQIMAAREGGVFREIGIAFIKVYAAYQHEGHRADGTYVIHHHPHGGKTHFLEDAVKSFARLLPGMIQREQKRVV